MNRTTLLVAYLALGELPVAVSPVAGQGKPGTRIASPVVADIDRFMDVQRRCHGWPGAALAIARANEVLLARGYGDRTVSGGPITERTPFPLGSVTKTMTALAVASLGEEGRIDLDAAVERYLPDFSLGGSFVPESITVHGRRLGLRIRRPAAGSGPGVGKPLRNQRRRR